MICKEMQAEFKTSFQGSKVDVHLFIPSLPQLCHKCANVLVHWPSSEHHLWNGGQSEIHHFSSRFEWRLRSSCSCLFFLLCVKLKERHVCINPHDLRPLSINSLASIQTWHSTHAHSPPWVSAQRSNIKSLHSIVQATTQSHFGSHCWCTHSRSEVG